MRRFILNLVLIWAVFLLQTGILSMIPYEAAVPNLLLIVTVAEAFLHGKRDGVLTGFASGLALDLFYGEILGFHALVFLYIGYFCGRFSGIYFEKDVRMPALLSAGADLIYGIVIYVARFLLKGKTAFPGYLTGVILPEVIITGVTAVLFYRLIYLLDRRIFDMGTSGKRTKWLKE